MEAEMTLYGVNNGISLQESQLIQLLQQQASRALGQSAEAQDQAKAAGTGQNMPSQADTTASGSAVPVAQWQPTDPALNPENINALLLELQTQQSSLDTTLLLSGSEVGPGGKTLADYLTEPDAVANDASTEANAGLAGFI